MSAALSPIIMQVACVFPDGSVGMTEASTTRNLSAPMTLSLRSTTPARHTGR